LLKTVWTVESQRRMDSHARLQVDRYLDIRLAKRVGASFFAENFLAIGSEGGAAGMFVGVGQPVAVGVVFAVVAV